MSHETETACSRTTVPSLSALLEHPAFQQGLADAAERFSDSYEDAPLTEEEMIDEVEMNVSRRVTENARTLCQLYGWKPTSYLHHLGYVLGTINVGLAYASSSTPQQ